MDTTIRIDGMTCGGCAASVMAAVVRVRGVEVLAVDPQAGTAQLRVAAGAPPFDAIAAAVEGAGFIFIGAVPVGVAAE